MAHCVHGKIGVWFSATLANQIIASNPGAEEGTGLATLYASNIAKNKLGGHQDRSTQRPCILQNAAPS
jgi:hypothetical protein